MSVDAPFVQMRTLEVLSILAILGKNSSSAVFLALGAFSSDPIAPSQRDLRNYTHLSRWSVSTALEFLCKHEFAHCLVDEEGVRRYRVSEKYFRYNGISPVSVRELVPVSGQIAEAGQEGENPSTQGEKTARDGENPSPSPVVVSTVRSRENKSSSTTSAAQKILFEAGIFSAYVDFKGCPLEEDQALEIAHWIASAPEKIDAPASYARSCLLANPQWRPPAEKKGQRWYDSYEEFVKR